MSTMAPETCMNLHQVFDARNWCKFLIPDSWACHPVTPINHRCIHEKSEVKTVVFVCRLSASCTESDRVFDIPTVATGPQPQEVCGHFCNVTLLQQEVIVITHFSVVRYQILCALCLLFRRCVFVRTWSASLKILSTTALCENLIFMITR